MTNRVREIHGVVAEKRAALEGDTQQVRVLDGDERVILVLSANSYPAGLTAAEARFVAAALAAAANRFDQRTDEGHRAIAQGASR